MTSLSQRGVVGFLLCVFSALLSVSSLTYAAVEDNPQQLVQVTTDKMLARLKQNKTELDKKPELIYDYVSEIVLPHFDFIRMSQWVLAKNWRVAEKEQKIRFIRAFRTLLIRTYGVALLEYTQQKINYLPLRSDLASGDVTVRTEIIEKGKQPVALNYSLHKKDKGWKVYDISVDGVSLISNYRTSFASEIKQTSIDALIERLEKHNQKAGA